MKEIWKDVPGFEGYYMVSNNGKVKSVERVVKCRENSTKFIEERILKSALYKTGYEYVVLAKYGVKKKFKVHRLVAMAFIENPLNLPFINHLNAVRNDNRVDNLEWCTHSRNMKHKFKLGNQSNKRSNNPCAKKVINIVTGKVYGCAVDAAVDIGMNYNTLTGMLAGHDRNHTQLRYL